MENDQQNPQKWTWCPNCWDRHWHTNTPNGYICDNCNLVNGTLNLVYKVRLSITLEKKKNEKDVKER